MTTLKNTLTEMFTDWEKSEQMMLEDCDTEFESGYAKELEEVSITYKKLDQRGGEDQGSEYYTIWGFTKGGESVTVKFDGYYQSYNGAEFEDWSFVEPKQKTITVWE